MELLHPDSWNITEHGIQAKNALAGIEGRFRSTETPTLPIAKFIS
jgi:hypothetical protein